MSQDFSAYETSVVLENFHKKIEVLEVLGEQILAGLGDGSLVVLEPGKDTDGTHWQVTKALKNFGQRRITQLQVWRAKGLLFSLSDDGVNAHHVPAFKLACQAGRSRGANQFAFDETRAMLCVAAKRRLILSHYNGNEFVELKELGLPDRVLTMGWCGDSICLGFHREYYMVHVNTGALTELFSCGKSGAPVIVPLSSGELLLSKENVGIFIGADGKPSRKVGLTWSDAPLAAVYSRPYVVALMPNHIEIRSAQHISQKGLAQVIPVKGMGLLSHSAASAGDVYAASGSGDAGILRLAPLPFAQQAKALADRNELSAALEMASLVPATQVEERKRLNDQLHRRYGYCQFLGGEYEEAMAHFGMCSDASPVVLLRLFPSLVSPEAMKPLLPEAPDAQADAVPEPQGEDFKKAVSVLLPYLLSHRTRLASSLADSSTGAEDSPSASSARPGSEEQSEGRGSRGQQSEAAQPSGRSSSQREQLSQALDTAILKAMLAMDDTGALLRFVQRPNRVSLGEGEDALKAAGRYSELVALYQERGQYSAALDLLRTLSLSPKQLEVAPKGASAELEGLTGVWAAVKSLVAVGASNVDLIRAHARWIVRADPEAGLEMFTEMQPPLAPEVALPILTSEAPSLCAPYLQAALASNTAAPEVFHTELALIYLRSALEQHKHGGAAGEHSSGEHPSGEEHREDPHGSENGHAKAHAPSLPARPDPLVSLKELITSSQHLDAKKVLLRVPMGARDFLETRALLLERLGRHQDALEIYVHHMKDPRLAEAYCDRMYDAEAFKQNGKRGQHRPSWSAPMRQPSYDMYLSLIQVYLERQGDMQDKTQKGSAPNSSNWEAVARLLSRKHDRIDPQHALDLLPGLVPLKAALPFLEGALRAAAEKRRNSSVVKSLRRSENLQLREEVIRCRQRCITVTYERACSICHKRIGTSAFVAFPEGSLAHYSCHKRQSRTSGVAGETLPTSTAPIFDISND